MSMKSQKPESNTTGIPCAPDVFRSGRMRAGPLHLPVANCQRARLPATCRDTKVCRPGRAEHREGYEIVGHQGRDKPLMNSKWSTFACYRL